MKILRIITRLNIGGPAQHVLLLTKAMQDEPYATTLVTGSCAENEGDMAYLADELGVAPVYVKEMSREVNIPKDIVALFKLYGIIKREKPDIIHTHTAKAGTLGRVASMLAGKAVRVHTFHGHSLQGYFSKAENIFFTNVERGLARLTDRIIAVSEEQRRDLSKKFEIAEEAKFTVIDLGLALERFLAIGPSRQGAFRKKAGIGEKEIVIGIVGRLARIKDHRMFLDAVREMLPRGYRFVVVGKGELERELREYANAQGISHAVSFVGWYRDIWEVYEGLDIAVLTSRNEGTPVSLIQALASSRPVVSTDVGGVPSVVRHGESGYLVSPGDIRGFAERVTELASDPGKRARFGTKGRESVKTKFSQERLVSDVKALYSALVSPKERGEKKKT